MLPRMAVLAATLLAAALLPPALRAHLPSRLSRLRPASAYRRVIIIAHYREPLEWAYDLPSYGWDVVVSEKLADEAAATEKGIRAGLWRNGSGAETGHASVELFPQGNLGYEPSALLFFIVTHYDDLPNHIVLLHGEAGAHNGVGGYASATGKELVKRLLRCMNPQWSGGYLSIADYCRVRSRLSENYVFLQSRIEAAFLPRASARDKAIIAALLPQSEGRTITWMSSAEFVVSRERVRRLPRSYWAALLAAATDSSPVPEYITDEFYRGAPGKLPAWTLETIWHVLFGEPLLYAPPPTGAYCGGSHALYLPVSACPQSVCSTQESALLGHTTKEWDWLTGVVGPLTNELES